MTPSTKPSSNWFALQKNFVRRVHPRKRHKVDGGESSASLSDKTPTDALPLPLLKRHDPDSQNEGIDLDTTDIKNGESIAALRRMVLGKIEYGGGSQTAPGKYLALDCEMVGVGIDGNESSLARVSIVNYTGAIILDVFVRQRERVVDYRTRWSGVRSTDLASSAKPFQEVQHAVAKLINNRILVGHAICNDLRALLLSHPSPQIRDTQSLAYKHRVVKSRRPALRVLVKQELGVIIQGGEHSSVTDARATMALFRLYKKQWECGFRLPPTLAQTQTKNSVDDASAGKASALARSSSCSVTRGRKRSRSVCSTGSATGTPSPALHMPSLASSAAPHSLAQKTLLSTSLKHEWQKSRSRPAANSTHRKGVSSGISTVINRGSRIKEVQGTGARPRDSVEKGSIVENNKARNRNRSGKVEEKWWENLRGGRKGNTKV